MFICKNCNKNFFPSHNAAKYVKPIFCGKSCKGKFEKTSYRTQDQLKSDICNLIKIRGKYLTKTDIVEELKVSSKTLNKFRISILQLNNLCGMKKPASVFESKVSECLSIIYKGFTINSQVTFETLLSPKNYSLRFDFVVEELKLVIEADGVQHSDENHYMSSEYTRECDKIKEIWCDVNNYKLIRIPYNRKVDLQYINRYVNFTATT